MANKHEKVFNLIIRESSTVKIMRYHYTPTQMVKRKNDTKR